MVNGEPSQPYVVLEDEGNIGKYNRANRSLTHFTENVPSFVVNWLLVSQVLPFPAFVLMVIFCIGRMLHMTGYTGGYGKHGPGFGLTMISSLPLEMLVLMIGLKVTFGISIGF